MKLTHHCLMLAVQHKAGKPIKDIRLEGGRWLVYSDRWQDMSSFLKGVK